MTQNTKLLFILGIMGAIIIVLGSLFFLLEDTNFDSKNEVNEMSEEEKEFNESGRAKAIIDETDLWKVYEDKNSGFSIKYPGNVSLGEKAENNLYSLSIKSEKIDLLEGTMGFNKETAEENIKFLENGEYGKSVDFPLIESKKVRKIGNVNAQEFMVVSRFEVCDIVFERKAYFFFNGHQVVVTLKGPKQEIISSLPEYFETNEENCGDEKIWNFEKQKDFFENFKNNIGSEVALNWFNLFDKIIGTLEFSGERFYDASLLQGEWVSVDDLKYEIEFIENKKIDYYSGEKSFERDFDIFDNKLIVKDSDGDFEYEIIKLTENSLEMIYLVRGNILKFTKK